MYKYGLDQKSSQYNLSDNVRKIPEEHLFSELLIACAVSQVYVFRQHFCLGRVRHKVNF